MLIHQLIVMGSNSESFSLSNILPVWFCYCLYYSFQQLSTSSYFCFHCVLCAWKSLCEDVWIILHWFHKRDDHNTICYIFSHRMGSHIHLFCSLIVVLLFVSHIAPPLSTCIFIGNSISISIDSNNCMLNFSSFHNFRCDHIFCFCCWQHNSSHLLLFYDTGTPLR